MGIMPLIVSNTLGPKSQYEYVNNMQNVEI